MSNEVVRAERRIAAPPSAIFAVLADPSAHAAIDGTGWVCDPIDHERLTRTGQRFGMAMHHEQHPPFEADHPDNSLAHLDELVAKRR